MEQERTESTLITQGPHCEWAVHPEREREGWRQNEVWTERKSKRKKENPLSTSTTV